MPLKKEEKGVFEKLLKLVHSNSCSCEYGLVFKNETIFALYDTDGETDNCLALDDPNYEEYWMIVFQNIATQELFEVNYHNMPKEVWCDGKKIDL